MSKKRVKEITDTNLFEKPKDVSFRDYVMALDTPELLSFKKLIEYSQVAEKGINPDFAKSLVNEGVIYFESDSGLFKLTDKAKNQQFWGADLIWDVLSTIEDRNEKRVRETINREPARW